ncbi:hypothetical protein QEZ40_005824 [Streptomyces katrae]|uniref:Uncharacterized protein n=1 Tax=Streptomyces katrae TaxID=68223 RepID=A0ABT7H3S4_9ACTN|nr:hypothetical protein [Streptomyces katrae]MDK9500196.1 hypothetical protein [Streptomyces katrae]
MTRPRRSGLLLPYVLLLLALLAVWAPGARAAADPCRADQLSGAKVTASVPPQRSPFRLSPTR